MRYAPKVKVLPGYSLYGDLSFNRPNSHGDFNIQNELGFIKLDWKYDNSKGCKTINLIEDENLLEYPPIFSHTGYFGFANRQWLEKLLNEKIPNPVRLLINKLLVTGSREQMDRREEDIMSLSWIALRGKIQAFDNSEYRIIFDYLLKAANKLGGNNLKYKENRFGWTFDDEFESFIKGESNIFFGGSIHARLIKSWWLRYTKYFVELFIPSDIENLLENIKIWPLWNLLVFGDKFKGENKNDLRDSLRELFIAMARMINSITQYCNGDKEQTWIRYFMNDLALSQMKEKGSRWSFIASAEDMEILLKHDNDFHLMKDDINDKRERMKMMKVTNVVDATRKFILKQHK